MTKLGAPRTATSTLLSCSSLCCVPTASLCLLSPRSHFLLMRSRSSVVLTHVPFSLFRAQDGVHDAWGWRQAALAPEKSAPPLLFNDRERNAHGLAVGAPHNRVPQKHERRAVPGWCPPPRGGGRPRDIGEGKARDVLVQTRTGR